MQTTSPDFNPSANVDVDVIKTAVLALEEVIMTRCPAGRRKSLALTNLETAAMYAVKSVFEP